MIHIVFNEGDVNVLQKAIELDETISGAPAGELPLWFNSLTFTPRSA